MVEFDPPSTERDLAQSVAAELNATGLEEIHTIGRGGFGIVYRCRQPSLDRIVAVKVLTSGLNSDDLARFDREQRVMGRLSDHPNIVSIFEVGTLRSNRPFIVMQYRSQGSLEERIRRSGPLSWHEVLHLGVKIAGALETAHRIGVLHRDVKPGNILLSDYGEQELADFGIARIVGGFETSTRAVTGSPAFTAPEVLTGESPTVSSDVYSLGATLFCALTGHAAFERLSGEDVVAQFVRITTQPAPEISREGIPDDVRGVIGSAMSGSAADRPVSAEELGELLRDAERHHYRLVDEMVLSSSPRSKSAERPERYSDPVHAIRSKRGNLPLELTSFVGRRHEMARVKRLLEVSRLVTLTGVGGVGKTRLALRAAGAARRAFGDGVWLIELGEFTNQALLVDYIAAGLGLQERSVHSPLEVLIDYLVDRQLLMVLDNCEHLIEAVAGVAQTLLRTCPGLRIIATSREPLSIDGEAPMRVPPLSTPGQNLPISRQTTSVGDALTLFAERAHAAAPDFELTERNTAVIAQICEQLEGLPLPIELAAVRLRAMSAAQILDRLTDRYALLAGGKRGAPTRQQTMRLSVDWSYELCTAEEQQLWTRLSVFVGGFELDAAEEVCGERPCRTEFLDVITSLVDKSILIREQRGSIVRFRMLEILREYGRENLSESGEDITLRRRHRDWCTRLALHAEEGWISDQQMDWIARLNREQLNLREALDFCVSEDGDAESGLQIVDALHPYWFARGLFSEARRWIALALAREDGPLTSVRVKALCNQSIMAGLQGDLDAGWSRIAEARRVAEQLADTDTDLMVTYVEGNLALYSGEIGRAIASFDITLDWLRSQTNPIRLLEALIGLGVASWLLHDTARAAASQQEILAQTERAGESVYRTYALWGLALVEWSKGDHERATQHLKDGVQLARHVDDPVCAALCIEALAWIAASQHQKDRAARLMGTARALRKSIGGSTVHIPGMVNFHDECVQQSRQALGSSKYDVAYKYGAAMTAEGAYAFAIDETSSGRTVQPSAPESVLTRREQQVAELVAAGMTNKAVATKLVISQRTAQGHVEHILQKLGFRSRAQIAAWFVEQERR